MGKQAGETGRAQKRLLSGMSATQNHTIWGEKVEEGRGGGRIHRSWHKDLQQRAGQTALHYF